MSKATGIIFAIAGIGGVALLARAASAASPTKQQTYIDKTLTKATGKGSKVDKAKGYVAKGTAEAQSAIDKINSLLK